jgi:exodeoxyribonuclease VII small subunit
MAEEPAALPPDIAALSFEAALKQLEDIVRKLEDGKVELEESIDIYGRGVLLKRHCEAKLQAAASAAGSAAARPPLRAYSSVGGSKGAAAAAAGKTQFSTLPAPGALSQSGATAGYDLSGYGATLFSGNGY